MAFSLVPKPHVGKAVYDARDGFERLDVAHLVALNNDNDDTHAAKAVVAVAVVDASGEFLVPRAVVFDVDVGCGNENIGNGIGHAR